MKRLILVTASVALAAACTNSEPATTTIPESEPNTTTTTIEQPAVTAPETSTTTSTTSTTVPAPARPVLLDRVSLLDLLALIPDNDASRALLQIDDYDLIRRLEGVGEFDPTSQTAHDWTFSWYPRETPESFFLTRGVSAETVAEYGEEFGVWLDDIHQEITFGFLPDFTRVFTFDDPEAVAGAVTTNATWSDTLDVAASPPATVYTWPGVEARLEWGTAARPRGEPGELAVVEDGLPGTAAGNDVLVRTYNEGVVNDTLDAVLGAATSLADNDTYRGLAEILEAEGASSIVISAEPRFASEGYPRPAEPVEAFYESNPLLTRYTAVAAGRVLRDNGWGAVVVLAHGTEHEAEENAWRLRQELDSGTTASLRPNSDLFSLENVEVLDTFVIARIGPGDSSPWAYLAPRLDGTLFWINDVRLTAPQRTD